MLESDSWRTFINLYKDIYPHSDTDSDKDDINDTICTQ